MLNMKVFPNNVESTTRSRTYSVRSPSVRSTLPPANPYSAKMKAATVNAAKRVSPMKTNIYSSSTGANPEFSQADPKNMHIRIDKETGARMCAVCHVTFTSGSHERDHMKGKKHAKMVVKVNGEFGRCELCSMKYQSARDGINHLFSQIHIKNQRELDLKSGRAPNVVAKPVRRRTSVVKPSAVRSASVIDEASEEDDDMQCIYTRKASSKEAGNKKRHIPGSSQRKRGSSTQSPRGPAAKKLKKSTQKRKNFCTRCGDPAAPENNFCGGCGAKL